MIVVIVQLGFVFLNGDWLGANLTAINYEWQLVIGFSLCRGTGSFSFHGLCVNRIDTWFKPIYGLETSAFNKHVFCSLGNWAYFLPDRWNHHVDLGVDLPCHLNASEKQFRYTIPSSGATIHQPYVLIISWPYLWKYSPTSDVLVLPAAHKLVILVLCGWFYDLIYLSL